MQTFPPNYSNGSWVFICQTYDFRCATRISYCSISFYLTLGFCHTLLFDNEYDGVCWRHSFSSSSEWFVWRRNHHQEGNFMSTSFCHTIVPDFSSFEKSQTIENLILCHRDSLLPWCSVWTSPHTTKSYGKKSNFLQSAISRN